MSKPTRTNVDVDVAPARAKKPRFRRLRAVFFTLVAILVGLGVWKAYELVLIGMRMYSENRSTVHLVVAAVVVSIIVGALWYMLRALRTDKRSQQSVLNDSASGHSSSVEASTRVDALSRDASVQGVGDRARTPRDDG